MEKSPTAPSPASEFLSMEDIIGIFKKAIAEKEDVFYPSFEEIQEALHVFLIHMKAIHPLYSHLVHSLMKGYNESVMEDEEKQSFLWLQGYIRYINIRVIAPLEEELRMENMSEGGGVTDDVSIAVEKIREDLRRTSIAIQELRQTQEKILELLKEHEDPQTKQSMLAKERNNTERLKELEYGIQQSEQRLAEALEKKN